MGLFWGYLIGLGLIFGMVVWLCRSSNLGIHEMRNSSFYKSVVLGQWLVPRTLTSSCDNECFQLSSELLLSLKRVLFCDVFHFLICLVPLETL